jgi:hypothetical protein
MRICIRSCIISYAPIEIFMENLLAATITTSKHLFLTIRQYVTVQIIPALWIRTFSAGSFTRKMPIVIRKLTFSDCFIDLSFKTLDEFREMNLNLTPVTWIRLRSALLHFRNLLTNRPNAINKCTEIEIFLNRPVKGSKRFRNYFNRELLDGEVLTAYRSVLTFAELTQVPVLTVSLLKNSLGVWNISFLGNSLREFFFKCRNNYLLVNTRVAAFDNTVDPHCTFCRIRNCNLLPRETFTHLFFDCPTTNDIRVPLIMQFFTLCGDVVAQLAKARLSEPDCNAAVPGSIPASSTVS